MKGSKTTKNDEKWYKYKNAVSYANEMNQWESFLGETFTVKRVGSDEN